jgi:hypothetical protein
VGDLIAHGDSIKAQETRADSIEVALNAYEAEGLTLLHVIPEYQLGPAIPNSHKATPLFVFHKPSPTGHVLSLEEIARQVDSQA